MPIKIEELCRYFRVGGSTVRALDGVSLNIDDGEYVTICGASGSGKSTLMNILGCLDVPTSGRYLLDGENACRRQAQPYPRQQDRLCVPEF